VPLEEVRVGSVSANRWEDKKRLAVVLVIVAPVLVLLLDPRTHGDAKIGRDGDIPSIEQYVEIGPK
jgi:hypothetical protein